MPDRQQPITEPSLKYYCSMYLHLFEIAVHPLLGSSGDTTEFHFKKMVKTEGKIGFSYLFPAARRRLLQP